MKKITTYILPVILGLAMMFTACTDILNPPEATDTAASEGRLIVQIGEEGRTLAPKDLTGLTYKLIIRSGDNIAFSGAVTPATSTAYNLITGNWDLIAEAYDAAGTLIANSTDNVTIVAGQDTKKNLAMIPVTTSDVAGTFKYSFTFPNINLTTKSITLLASTPNSAVTWDQDDAKEDAVLNTEETLYTLAGSQVLPPGKYTLTVDFKSDRYINGNNLKVYRQEVVYIYPTMTTEAVFAFDEADFTADVRLAGTASVYDWDEYYTRSEAIIDTDYIPRTVYLWSNGTPSEIVEQANITQNTETKEYEWELFVPSNDVAASLSTVYLSFDAAKVGAPTKIITSGKEGENIDIHGNSNIYLSTATTTFKGLGFTMPGTGGSITAINDDIAVGGWAEFTVTTPTNFAMVANNMYSLYFSDTRALPENIVTNTDGTITVKVAVPEKNPVDYKVYASFFRIRGGIHFSTGVPDTNGYEPTLVEAFEPAEDTEEEDAAPIKIGQAVPVDYAVPPPAWGYEIVIPKGYVWRADSAYVSVKTTMTTTTAGNDPYVSNNPEAVDITNWINNDDDDDATAGLDYISLFTVEGVETLAIDTDTIRVSWDAADWAKSGYYVYSNISGPYALDETVAAGKTSVDITDTSMMPGTTYWFYVVGRKTATVDGNTSNSAWGQVKQPAVPALSVSQNYITDGDGDALGINTVDLSWTTVPSGAGYTIERNVNDTGWTTVANLFSNGTSNRTDTNFTSINPGAMIRYRINVRDTSGNTEYASDWTEGSTPVYAPSHAILYPGSNEPGYLNMGEKRIYYVPYTDYQHYLTLFDRDVDSGQTFDARTSVYNRNGSTLLYDQDTTNNVLLTTNYSPIYIIVKGYSSSSSGTYSILLNN